MIYLLRLPLPRLAVLAAVAALVPGMSRAQSAAAPAAKSDQPVSLSEFEVTSAADKGYQSMNAVGATKTNTPILDLAFTVAELNPELLQDLSPNYIYEAVRYVSSVSQNNDRVDTPNIRGFNATVANDGLLAASGFNEPLDMANIDRMEVVKGASAVMYGSVQSGGLVNIVHKQANAVAQTNVSATYGSYDFYRGMFDTNMPLLKSGDQELDYRLIVSGQDYKSFQEAFHQKKYLISNNFTYKPAPGTKITLRVDYFDVKGLNNSSLPYDYSGVLLNVPISFDRGEPSLDRQHNHHVQAELIADQKLSENWALKASVNYTADNEFRREVFLNTPPATDPTQWVRFEQIIPQNFDSEVSEADLLGNFNIGPTKHKVLIGAYSMALENGTANVRYGPLTPNFNVLNPVYGAGVYTVGPLVTSALREFFAQSYDWAVFVQDQIQLINDRLYVTVGGRQDYNQITTTNNSPFATGQLVFTQTYTKASPRIATLFKITNGLSAYVSYDQSFVPAPGTNSFAGTPLPPPTAQQREVGVKYVLLDGRITGSVAAFEIDRNNVSAADPINPGFVIAVGQIKSTGWEADMTSFITPHWQIYGGFGHFHNWDAVDTVKANIGEVFNGVPWWTMGLFTKYDFRGTALNGLEVGAGVTGMSGISVNTGFGPYTPTSYIFNPEISYTWKKWRFSLNGENLLNNRYYIYASSDRYAVPGQPKELFFSVKTSF